MRWVDYVAPSFTEMLRQSAYFADDEWEEANTWYGLDDGPYEHAEKFLDWQRSTEGYLAQFGPVESRLA